jgi:glyoxylate reductase
MTHSASKRKAKIFVTRRIENLERLSKDFKGFEVEFNSNERDLSPSELQMAATNYDGLITMLCDQVDEGFLRKNSHLKVISNYAVGLNNIDLTAARKMGTSIGHTPGVLTHTTAETAIMLLLNVTRSYSRAKESVKEGRWKTWEPTVFNGVDLREKTLGIIGFGRIGQDFAQKAYALWGLNIHVLERDSNKDLELSFPFKSVNLEEFYESVDVISLHCPLNSETANLLDVSFIKKMKKPFFLINTARGQVHDEQDLIEAIDSKKILGLGLDVTDPEPMAAGHPLLSYSNVEVIPHIGSATNLTRAEMTRMSLENIDAGLRGDRLPYAAF